jgi:hypothetical protein
MTAVAPLTEQTVETQAARDRICRSLDDMRHAFRARGISTRMIAAGSVENARLTPIENVLETRGVRLKGNRERCGPCPVCGGTDRFSINTTRQIFNCRGCGGKGRGAIDIVRFLDECDFRTAVETLAGKHLNEPRPVPVRPVLAKPVEDSREYQIAGALKIWGASVDPRGTLAERYLNGRGLDLGDDLASEVIRWHAGLGAMVALFRNIETDEPQAVSRTYLDGNARKTERKFLGPVGGAAIKLDADDTVLAGLHVGEGIETCMTGRQYEGRKPTWALGSAGVLADFPVLNGIETLTVFAEKDCVANANSIKTCGARWQDAGRGVLINMPLAGKDLNDCIQVSK